LTTPVELTKQVEWGLVAELRLASGKASLIACLQEQEYLGSINDLLFHLTARPWRPLEIQRERYLDVLEGLFRFSIRHQNDQGAIIDPFLHREHQYATPYFAYAVGTLIAEGKATDLSSHGILAMIESAWTERQSKRIAAAPFFLYHDGGVSCEAKHHCRTSGTCGGRRIRHTARR